MIRKNVLSAAEVWDINETIEAREIEFSKSFLWLTSKVSSYPQDPLAVIVPDHFWAPKYIVYHWFLSQKLISLNEFWSDCAKIKQL